MANLFGEKFARLFRQEKAKIEVERKFGGSRRGSITSSIASKDTTATTGSYRHVPVFNSDIVHIAHNMGLTFHRSSQATEKQETDVMGCNAKPPAGNYRRLQNRKFYCFKQNTNNSLFHRKVALNEKNKVVAGLHYCADGKLVAFAVLPRFQNKGIGKLILVQYLSHMKRLGVTGKVQFHKKEYSTAIYRLMAVLKFTQKNQNKLEFHTYPFDNIDNVEKYLMART